MILEDFVMLGRTVPEPQSDGRVFVCSAGWSAEYRKLVRIYPLAKHNGPKRWSVNTVRLERNPKDSRDESFKLAGDRSPDQHHNINTAFTCSSEVKRAERSKLLKKGPWVDSIAEANDRRMSLALLHPKHTPELFFEHNADSPNSPQLRLFDDQPTTEGARRFAFIPRLRFVDHQSEHRLMLRDWGCFEYLRKYGDQQRYGLADALHLNTTSSLLIGNLNNQRNAWLVIAVLNGICEQSNQLAFPELGAA